MWKCPPSTILVPVDFGEASARAIEVAAALAARTGARLRVLHAESLEAPPYFTHDQLAALEGQRRAARSHGEQFLADFAKKHGATAFDASFTDGSAVAAIIEASRTTDLVVMGTHGRRGPSLWWLGSVAERVAHESPAPVLVVRGDLPSPLGVFQRALVVAPSALEGEAVRVAKGLSQAFGGQVIDSVVRCESDIARAEQATMVVVSRSEGGHGSLLGHRVEQWMRSCTLPMLFVPSAVVV